MSAAMQMKRWAGLYDELAAVTQVETRAWLIAVGRPRIVSVTRRRLSADDARRLLRRDLGTRRRMQRGRAFVLLR